MSSIVAGVMVRGAYPFYRCPLIKSGIMELADAFNVMDANRGVIGTQMYYAGGKPLGDLRVHGLIVSPPAHIAQAVRESRSGEALTRILGRLQYAVAGAYEVYVFHDDGVNIFYLLLDRHKEFLRANGNG